MECFVYSVIVSQNDAFSNKETENNICRRRHGHAVVRFFFWRRGSSHHQTLFEFYRTTCIPFQTIPSFCDCFINGFHSKFLTADTKFLLMSLNFIAGSRYLHTSQERSRTFLRSRPMFSCSYPYFQIRSSSRISGIFRTVILSDKKYSKNIW